MKMQKGNSVIPNDSIEMILGDKDEISTKSSATKIPKISQGVKIKSSQPQNQRSRFIVLENHLEMETETIRATEEGEKGKDQTTDPQRGSRRMKW